VVTAPSLESGADHVRSVVGVASAGAGLSAADIATPAGVRRLG